MKDLIESKKIEWQDKLSEINRVWPDNGSDLDEFKKVLWHKRELVKRFISHLDEILNSESTVSTSDDTAKSCTYTKVSHRDTRVSEQTKSSVESPLASTTETKEVNRCLQCGIELQPKFKFCTMTCKEKYNKIN